MLNPIQSFANWHTAFTAGNAQILLVYEPISMFISSLDGDIASDGMNIHREMTSGDGIRYGDVSAMTADLTLIDNGEDLSKGLTNYRVWIGAHGYENTWYIPAGYYYQCYVDYNGNTTYLWASASGLYTGTATAAETQIYSGDAWACIVLEHCLWLYDKTADKLMFCLNVFDSAPTFTEKTNAFMKAKMQTCGYRLLHEPYQQRTQAETYAAALFYDYADVTQAPHVYYCVPLGIFCFDSPDRAYLPSIRLEGYGLYGKTVKNLDPHLYLDMSTASSFSNASLASLYFNLSEIPGETAVLTTKTADRETLASEQRSVLDIASAITESGMCFTRPSVVWRPSSRPQQFMFKWGSSVASVATITEDYIAENSLAIASYTVPNPDVVKLYVSDGNYYTSGTGSEVYAVQANPFLQTQADADAILADITSNWHTYTPVDFTALRADPNILPGDWITVSTSHGDFLIPVLQQDLHWDGALTIDYVTPGQRTRGSDTDSGTSAAYNASVSLNKDYFKTRLAEIVAEGFYDSGWQSYTPTTSAWGGNPDAAITLPAGCYVIIAAANANSETEALFGTLGVAIQDETDAVQVDWDRITLNGATMSSKYTQQKCITIVKTTTQHTYSCKIDTSTTTSTVFKQRIFAIRIG